MFCHVMQWHSDIFLSVDVSVQILFGAIEFKWLIYSNLHHTILILIYLLLIFNYIYMLFYTVIA